MLYTSYFANLNKLPEITIPISICGKAPDWYHGIQYKVLAPKYAFFIEWKQNHDNDFYIKHFNEEVLSKLNSQKVMIDLQERIPTEIRELQRDDICASPNVHIALICYEKPSDFCHRHLVAEWLTENGYNCKEWLPEG